MINRKNNGVRYAMYKPLAENGVKEWGHSPYF